VRKKYECQARSERASNKEKKTLNNMRKCNKSRSKRIQTMCEKIILDE
jgi:hypothetical protein